MTGKIPYGIANYAELVRKQCYFVDKSRYIALLEQIENPIFLRPKRFGKSLFCTTLEHYYDVTLVDRFEELFGHTWIGQHPTEHHNRCIVLPLDFSTIYVGKTLKKIEESFQRQCNSRLRKLRDWYAPLLDDMPDILQDVSVSDNLGTLFDFVSGRHLPRIYVIIDEYDILPIN